MPTYNTLIVTDENALTVFSGGVLDIKTGGVIRANGVLASHIADAVAITGGESPTEAEHNALVTKINAIIAVLEGIGATALS